jgi:ABC-type polysaccharide/polyol phosphate transport system ATPase subunit
MGVLIRAENLCLDVPAFMQREREATGWASLFLGAAFDPPRRQLVRLLEGIDFEVKEGDRLAILGRNGAGKSTLLRVLNRVYQPTTGLLTVEGSCQALLNMSLGFNGEATVRENIYLRGTAMGLRAAFLRGQVPSILEFAGLQEKVNHRLRTLSSGQKMRLGFAISTSVQHDIMLMDEWVGAGDADFMRKARERLQSRVGGSKIVVLASHSTGLLRDTCNRGIVLEKGRLMHAGDITSALKYYHDLLAQLRKTEAVVLDEAAAGGAQVFGAVEEIRAMEGKVMLDGWMIDNEGGVPAGLVLQVADRRFPLHRLTRLNRPDVMRHFGLASEQCGFQATFMVPGLHSMADLHGAVQVLGGATPEDAHAPLRLAGGVQALLAGRT